MNSLLCLVLVLETGPHQYLYEITGKTWATPPTTLFHRAIVISLKTSGRDLDCPMRQSLFGGWPMFHQLCHTVHKSGATPTPTSDTAQAVHNKCQPFETGNIQ